MYFHISIQIFCNLFICLVFDGLLQSIYFRMFCSKHSITFDTYLQSCRFHCVDIFYISFRSCETFTVTNSEAILLLVETPSNFKSFQRITERLRIIFFKKNKVSTNSFQLSWMTMQYWIFSGLVVRKRFSQLQTNSPVIASLYILQIKNKCTYHVPYLP